MLTRPTGGIKGRAVSGALSTGSAQIVRVVVQFASVVILARLLTPRDFGIFAMITPIVGFSTMFQDFGLSQALVTAPTLSQAEAAGMFRINLMLSAAIAAILVIAAPGIALLYREPIVMWLTMAMAAQIVIAGATVSHTALLSRSMRFGRLAQIDIAKAILGIAIAIVIAFWWPGPWALAAQTIGAALVGMVLAWTFTGWRPVGRVSLKTLRPMLRFGAGMTTFNLSNYLSRNADNVMIGLAYGAVPLGNYDRAYKLLLYPLQQINQPIASVMIPVLSRLADEPDRYREAYRRTLRQTLLFTLPGMAALICTAPVLVPTLLGARWAPVVTIFQWLGIAGLHQTISNTFGWLFVSQRRTGEYARFGLFSTATCLIAFAAGLPWGPEGVAAAYALSGVFVRLPLIIWQVGGRGPVSRGDIIAVFLPYLVAVAAGMATWWFAAPMIHLPPLAFLVISGALIFFVSWLLIALRADGRRTFADAWGLLPARVRNRLMPRSS